MSKHAIIECTQILPRNMAIAIILEQLSLKQHTPLPYRTALPQKTIINKKSNFDF